MTWLLLCVLARLVFSYNNLNGTLPAELSGLSSVEILALEHNPRLHGTIPSSIGQLVKLRALYLNDASLSGPIPEALWHLTQLEKLILANNQLTSTISSRIGNLKKLTPMCVQHAWMCEGFVLL